MASPTLPVTIEDLKILVPSVLDNQAQMFIDAADAIVQSKNIVSSYPARTVYLIELNLAAHFATIAPGKSGGSGALIFTRVGSSQENYADYSADVFGIAKSTFGQTALALDTQGILSSLATVPVKAQFRVV